MTLEWTQGFTLSYEGLGEVAWRYKFSQLRGSSDDGKSRLKLHFQELDSIAIETKVILIVIIKITFTSEFQLWPGTCKSSNDN